PNDPDELCDGRNWQENLDSVIQTISNTEYILMGTKCPICQEPFKNGQRLKKYRCGHVVCIECFNHTTNQGWTRCTVCRKSGTTRMVSAIIEQDLDVDLSVFVQPESSVAAAAAAATESSSSDFLPRHVINKMLIKRHQENR
ncbi:MAG: RING finger domain-containing protein, partial [Candidatus Fonsibacter sp.]